MKKCPRSRRSYFCSQKALRAHAHKEPNIQAWLKTDNKSSVVGFKKNMTSLCPITNFKGFSHCDHAMNAKLIEETPIFFLENLIISTEYFTCVHVFTFVALKESTQME